jgi:tRNA-dihydrouridine synthase B
MAEAARYAQDAGFAVVDINFGCPARKVCGMACGSAIMGNEPLAREILEAVAGAVDIPVTVKMRTGWDGSHRNAIEIAKAAEGAGFAAVTIHGRTREDLFRGKAEYRTIARAVRELSIPVVANGDIDGPQKAVQVLKQTSAAGVMIGRAACGNPWLLGRIGTVLLGGADPGEPDRKTAGRTVLRHLRYHLEYWGEGLSAVRTFRKHAGWYLARFGGGGIAAELMKEQDAAVVCRILEDFFEEGLRV